MSYSDESLVYPSSPQGPQIDIYHGVEVPDPYRWLEAPDSDETQAWVAAQNQVTFQFLNQIAIRERRQQRLTQLWDYEKYGIPFRGGDAQKYGVPERYFYFKNDGLQNQSVLYTLTSLDAEPRVLLDPNKLSEDGTVALSGLVVSEDARLMAYGLST